MIVRRVLLVCTATVLLLDGGQAFSIRPAANRAKRECSAGQSLSDGGDLSAKESLYHKMFHNAFSKFLEAMVKCSEEYAQKKKLDRCCGAHDEDGKKHHIVNSKFARNDDDMSPLPLIAEVPSSWHEKTAFSPSGKNSQLIAKKQTPRDDSKDVSPLTGDAQDVSASQAHTKDKHSEIKSKYSEVAEPIGQYSQKQPTIQLASSDVLSKAVHIKEQYPEKNINSATVFTTERDTDQVQESITESDFSTQTNYENTEHSVVTVNPHQADKNLRTEIPPNEKSDTESKSALTQEGKIFDLESSSSTNDEEVTNTTENSVEYYAQPKNAGEEKYENMATSSSSSEDEILWENNQVTHSVTEPTGTDHTKAASRTQPTISSQHSNTDAVDDPETTSDTSPLVTPEGADNGGTTNTLPSEHAESRAAAGSEETTTARPEDTLHTADPVKDSHSSGAQESKNRSLFVESRDNESIFDSKEHNQNDKVTTTSDKSENESVTDQAPERQYKAPSDMSLMNLLQRTAEADSASESSVSVSQEQLYETTSSKTLVPNVHMDLESRESVEDTRGNRGSDAPLIESASESHEKIDTGSSSKTNMSKSHKDNELISSDSLTSTDHTTSAHPSLRSLPQERSGEHNYSSTELSPNPQSNELSGNNSSEKPYDRFGRGSAVSIQESNPDNGLLTSASLKSEKIHIADDPVEKSNSLLSVEPHVSGDDGISESLLRSSLAPESDHMTPHPPKLGCECHITNDFLEQLKNGVWKSLIFEVRPQ